jgi:hypothetical protein
MTRLVRWIRRLVQAVMMLVALVAGHHAAPTPAAPNSPAAVAPAPATAPVPAPPAGGRVPAGPTPHCTYAIGVKADGTKRWIVGCIVYGQDTTLPGDWPTARAARDALFAFQRAWRDAVKNGTPL